MRQRRIPPSQTPREELIPRPWTMIEVARTKRVESTYIIRMSQMARGNVPVNVRLRLPMGMLELTPIPDP